MLLSKRMAAVGGIKIPLIQVMALKFSQRAAMCQFASAQVETILLVPLCNVCDKRVMLIDMNSPFSWPRSYFMWCCGVLVVSF